MSPGYDGLPVEFYQQFWTYIKDHLLHSYQYALQNEELSFSQQQAIKTV